MCRPVFTRTYEYGFGAGEAVRGKRENIFLALNVLVCHAFDDGFPPPLSKSKRYLFRATHARTDTTKES